MPNRFSSCLRRTSDSVTLFVCTFSAVALLLALTGCTNNSTQPFDLSRATYVGKENCVSCHQEQTDMHLGSHHDKAMELATQATVLADFDDAQFEHHGIVNRFFQRDDKFFVHTEGPDGQMRDFEVKYVFGVDPLQQYMVELPAEGASDGASDGASKPTHADKQVENSDTEVKLVSATSQVDVPRIQVLRLCWDTIKGEWFYLPPPDVEERLDPSDDLHWTGIAQRWNNMCAECHSTNYQKNFVPPNRPGKLVSTAPAAEDADSIATVPNYSSMFFGEYRSSFSEINVSCEACHGPGSVHVELSEQWFPGWNRERGYGLANLKATAENQIQACAPCHSRRNVVFGDFRASDNYYDHYSNTLLDEGVYYPDGQILDEDYVHGSFIQSKMYHKGIKCSDCHDPHTARLIHDGNRVCTSCHQHPQAKYDTVAHHFHKPDSDAAKCVNCHMPATTYMAVDARRDHSFRIPRPDLSTKLGTPNACTGCHLEPANIAEVKRGKLALYQDWMLAAREGDAEVQAELERVNQWCDDACEKWYGENRRRDQHFGIAIAAGQRGDADAEMLLRELLSKRGADAPAVARATALQVLRQVSAEAAADEAEKSILDEHPLVRSSATSALLGSASQSKSVTLLETALKDPVRSVRTEAARNLLEYPPNYWNQSSASALRKALTELMEGLEYSNDRAGAHLALGILAEQQGRDQQAMRHYETAIAVEPGVAGPRTNLASLLERNLGAQVSATATGPSELQQEVLRLREEELPLLARDARLLPEAAAIQYRYGLALYVAGDKQQAVVHLRQAAELEPGQAAYAQATAMIYEALEQWDLAIQWAETALRVSGNDPQYALLLERIRTAAGK